MFAVASDYFTIVQVNAEFEEMELAQTYESENGPISHLAWNNQIDYVIATGTKSGVVDVWNLKRDDPIQLSIPSPEFSDVNAASNNVNTRISWSDNGSEVLIAYDHIDFTYLTKYFLRQLEAPTGEFHGGHSKPIIDIIENKNDKNFVLSLSRDGSVTCWSIKAAKPVDHFHHVNAESITWLLRTPDTFISVNFDGSISHHKVNFTKDLSLYSDNDNLPPQWLLKKGGVSFGFGNKFVSHFLTQEDNEPRSVVNLSTITNDSNFSEKVRNFVDKIESNDFTSFLDEKIAENDKDKNVGLMWTALKNFGKNENVLFNTMGYDSTSLQNEVLTNLNKSIKSVNKPVKAIQKVKTGKVDLDTFFTEKSEPNKKTASPIPEVTPKTNQAIEKHTVTETISKNINWNAGSEKLIKQSLLIGDMENAIELALNANRDAEALLIASMGSQELFNNTKAAFFSKNKDLFIKNIFSSIINKSFNSLLDYNILKDWKEYILYAKTYLKDKEFIEFANNLGDKLAQGNEVFTAVTCYILGRNYIKSVEILYKNYLKETESGGNNLSQNDKKQHLQTLIEQVLSIKYILDYSDNDSITDKLMVEYAEMLISESLFVEACRYLFKVNNKENKVMELYDRLYNYCSSFSSEIRKLKKINPHYNIINVKPKLPQKESVKVKTGGQVIKGNNQLFGSEQRTEISKDPINFKGNQNKNLNITNPSPSNNKLIANETNKPLDNVNLGKNVINKQIISNPPRPIITSTNNDKITSNNTNNTSNFNSNQNNNKTLNNPPPIVNRPPIISNLNQNKDNGIETNDNTSNKGSTKDLVNNQFGNNKNIVNNPPRPVINKNQGLNLVNNNINSNNKGISNTNNMSSLPRPNILNQNNNKTTNNIQENQEMSADEETVYNGFEKLVSLYIASGIDENKQKDFNNKINTLFNKLKGKELKQNIIKPLVDYVACKISYLKF